MQNGCLKMTLQIDEKRREAVCKASLDNYFVFLHIFFLGMVLITASCTMSGISVHSSSGTLSIGSNPLKLFATSTYSCKGLDLGYT